MSRIGGRLVLLFVGLLLGIPAYYYSVVYVSTPVTYAGDALEERECRHCGGSGRDEALAEQLPQFGGRCVACRGDGRVQVILPGPLRPMQLHGTVYDESRVDPMLGPIPAPNPLAPAPGSLPGAEVVFTRADGETIELRSSRQGKFLANLAPGRYTLRVSLSGFEAFEDEVTVEPLTEPIWLENARFFGELEDYERMRSEYGLDYDVVLSPL